MRKGDVDELGEYPQSSIYISNATQVLQKTKAKSNEPVSRAIGNGMGLALGGLDGHELVSALPRGSHRGQKHAHQKEIVSAMVRMNTQGL